MAYDAWCDAPGRMTYAVYRAAEDRADAAEVALMHSARRRSSSPDVRSSRQPHATVVRSAESRADGRSRGPHAMSVDELGYLLDGVPDTRELVIRRAGAWAPERDAWRDAHEDAAGGLRPLAARAHAGAYAAYRAAQDREDAAQDTLAGGR